MAYQSWSVVFGEQPSASKWGILGTNDASFNDGTGIAGLYKNLLATDSNPYKFKVYRNAAANAGSSPTYAKVVFDTELYDTNNNFASGTYTAPVTGFYEFSWCIGLAATAGNGATALYLNGATHAWGNEVSNGGGSGGTIQMQLSATNTVDIYAVVSSTAAINVGSAPIKTWFCGHLICRT